MPKYFIQDLKVSDLKVSISHLDQDQINRDLDLFAFPCSSGYLLIYRYGLSKGSIVQSITGVQRVFKTLDSVNSYVRKHFPDLQGFQVSYTGDL